jgi:hypothetical protein
MDLARIFNGKKYMWDGRSYENEQEMKKAKQEYQNQGFDVESIAEDKKYYLFSRRVVKDVVVEGSPI